MTEQDEIVTAFGYVVRMQRLLRDAQDSLEYVYREEPEGLSGDEELAAALERLLACLDKWTLPLQESRARAARAARSVARRGDLPVRRRLRVVIGIPVASAAWRWDTPASRSAVAMAFATARDCCSGASIWTP